ncbi:hypothetical protein IWX81_002075 [Salinibacterium sp. CAN_S4]|uniref:hypothetical protein n=1 Tax=Salinibacterium sp. CAN_S4 TaxID=2787727 RepID=UPI0018EF71F9
MRLSFLNRFRSDSGYALPAVIILSAVMLVLVTGSLSVTSSGMVKADDDQDAGGALAAAYAGVAEYQSRLSNDSTYQKYGNSASLYTSSPASTVSLPTGAAANPAFGVLATDAWAIVPGSDNRASYRYEINNSQYGTSGVIKLRVTGKVGNVTRTIVADLRQKGFLDFLYFTDFETLDPDIFGGTDCDRYAWANPARPVACQKIQFGAADTINGPLHTNDRLSICGSTFNGDVTSASTLAFSNECTGTAIRWNGSANAVIKAPAYRSAITIPPTNSQLRKEARNDLSTDVPRPGCLYTGPTEITLNSDGTMTVSSPWTKYTNISLTPGISSANPAQCGTLSALRSAAGATIPVLEKNLIYVQNVPNDTSDVNYSAGLPTNFVCSGSGRDQSWSFRGTTFPMAGESRPATSSTTAPAYGCKNGDAFVKGTLAGELTIGSENYVYVTGDVKYANAESSILGLIGQNAVWVYNPMAFTYNSSGTITGSTAVLPAAGGRTIQAAVLSVAHTIMVQNYQYGGQRGTLTVLGALAQKFRGTVATTSGGSIVNGYAKSYTYDERLRFTAPPKFLTPVSTTYGVTQYASVNSAFTPQGAKIP